MHSFNDIAAVEYCEFLKENQVGLCSKIEKKIGFG